MYLKAMKTVVIVLIVLGVLLGGCAVVQDGQSVKQRQSDEAMTQDALSEADRISSEARKAYYKQDYRTATTRYRDAALKYREGGNNEAAATSEAHAKQALEADRERKAETEKELKEEGLVDENEFRQVSPASIVTFSSVEEGDLIRFYFQLQDSNGRRVTADGQVRFKIMDNDDNLLYEKNFSVNSEEFVEYGSKLTGQSVGEAFEWRVPVKDIKKGFSNIFGFGKAEIRFVTGGKSLSAVDESVSIPSLSAEDISERFEEEYDKNKVVLGKSLRKGNFRVELVSFGFYEAASYFGAGLDEYLRVDFLVRNTGSEREYFSPSMSIIDSDGNQYDAALFGGTLDTIKNMFPDTKQEGYVLFEDVPKDIDSAKLVFEQGYDDDYDPYVFEYHLPFRK